MIEPAKRSNVMKVTYTNITTGVIYNNMVK
jgi:hypothetical protein